MATGAETKTETTLIHDALHFLFPKNCFEELFVKYDFFHAECQKLVLSRFLGLGIILGSIMVKVPQILNIWRARSGVGVSLNSQALELLAVTASMAYSITKGYPFSSYGETLFLAIQTALIVHLILHYRGQTVLGLVFLATYTITTYVLCFGILPQFVVAALQAANIPIVVGAKALQLYENYWLSSTGNLSVVTVFLQFAGSLARIFTSQQETGDSLVVMTYVVASLMNGLIFAQIFIYWGRKPTKKTQ